MSRAIPLAFCLVVTTWADGTSAVHDVPGEFPTLSGALSSATVGDTVLVTSPGVYWESVEIPPGVSLVSFLGRGEVLIIGNQGEPVVTFAYGDETAVLSGFQLDRDGQFNPPTVVSSNPQTVVSRCNLFSSGPDLWSQPALLLNDGGVVRDCELRHGAESAIVRVSSLGAEVVFEDCVFWEYVFPTGLEGFPQGAALRFDHCSFRQSRIDFGIYDSQSNEDFDLVFENSIFYNPSQFWARFLDSTVPAGFLVQYNCWWPDDVPAYGVIPEEALGPGNFSADPMFCVLPEVPGNPPKEAWLESESPCIEAASDGSNVGARWGVCGVTSVGEPLGAPVEIALSNPVSSSLQFEVFSGGAYECHASVVDASGRLAVAPAAVRLNHGGGKGSIDLQGVPAGSYFLQIETELGQTSRKFVLLK